MTTGERYDIIMNELARQGYISCDSAAARCGVSGETIRRDLKALEEMGKLSRVRGGATLADSFSVPDFPPLDVRLELHKNTKIEAANIAADLIEEGDTIGLDSGSTANPFAEILAGRFEKLTVVTFSLDIVRILGDKPGITILVPGGCYLSGERIISGFMAEQGLGRFHVGKSFICPSSFSVTHGIGMFKPEFYPLERALMSISEKKIFVGDSSKFGVVAPIRLCDAGEADVIVSDSGLDEKTADEFRAEGVRVINSPLHKNETETH